MPAITPSLWFDHDPEEAAQFYTSVFPNSSIEGLNRQCTGRRGLLGMRKIVIAELEAAVGS